MNNQNVMNMLNNCKQEIEDIQGIKKVVASTSLIIMFITRYSLIKACGTIELAYKTIVADFCENAQSSQVKNFILNRVRNSSDNPTLEKMYNLLNSFDEEWNKKFKDGINILEDKEKIFSSLKSLTDSRNEFAHGGNPTISFDDVVNYFKDACLIIEVLDRVINEIPSNTS